MNLESAKSFLVNYPSTIAAILTLGIAGAIVGLGSLKPELLLPYIAIGLSFLAFNALLQNHSRQEDRKIISSINDALNRIEHNQMTKISSIDAPSPDDTHEYIELWGGFDSGAYRAYNPSFQIESRTLDTNQEELIKRVFYLGIEVIISKEQNTCSS